MSRASWTRHVPIAVDVAGHRARVCADHDREQHDARTDGTDEPRLRVERRPLAMDRLAGADRFTALEQAHDDRAHLLEVDLDVAVERIVALRGDLQRMLAERELAEDAVVRKRRLAD